MHSRGRSDLMKRLMFDVRQRFAVIDPFILELLSGVASPLGGGDHKAVIVPDERTTLTPGYRVTASTGLKEILRIGWNDVETWGAWTEGHRSIIVFKVPTWLQLPAELIIAFIPFLSRDGMQGISIYMRSDLVFSGTYTDEQEQRIFIPIKQSSVSDDRCVDLVFDIHEPTSPRDVGRGDDERKIGLALRCVELSIKGT